MRVIQERRDTKRQNRNPEINQIPRPERQRHIEQHQQRPHPEVDARSRETRIEDGERDPGRRESTAGGDVSSPAEGQVVQDGVRVDLGGEDFEDGGEGRELFA